VRRMFVAVVVLVLAAMPVGAWASSSLLGPSGLILIPTADTLGTSQFNVGGSWFSSDSVDQNVLYANIGLLPGLEIGAARVDNEDAGVETILNAKFRLPQPMPVKLSLAVGVIDLTDQIDTTPYVVASHTVGAGLVGGVGSWSNLRVHLGVGGGEIGNVFGGLSANYGTSTLIAEYDGSNLNLGVKLPVAPKLEVTAATVDAFGDFAIGLSFSSPW